jgi:serine/threonine-protein kinase RsbT
VSRPYGRRASGTLDIRQGFSIPIEREEDVVNARNAGRELSRALGFSEVGQTKMATAISELARNVVQYAGQGRVEIRPFGEAGIEVVVADQGPGIADVGAVMAPGYRSRRGMGMGLRGTQRIVDEFHIVSAPGRGTTVTLRKRRA